MKQIISTPNAPAAIGAYSQAVVVNNLVYASGQLGIDPTTGALAGNDFRSQAEQSLRNCKAIVEAAGSSMEKLVKVTVFMADMSDFATLNELYAQYIPSPFPARSAVAVKTLPKNALVEIDWTVNEKKWKSRIDETSISFFVIPASLQDSIVAR